MQNEEDTNGEGERGGEEEGRAETQSEKENKHCLMIVTEQVWLSESEPCLSVTARSQWRSAAAAAAAEHLPSCYHTAALTPTRHLARDSLYTHTHTLTQHNTLINSTYTYTMKHPPRPLLETETLNL